MIIKSPILVTRYPTHVRKNKYHSKYFDLAANAFRSNASTMAAMEMFEEHEGTHILQSLDGFAISLNSDGRFLYISETVSIYLGLSQVRTFCMMNMLILRKMNMLI